MANNIKARDVRSSYEALRKRVEALHRKAASSRDYTAIMFCDLANSTASTSKRDQVISHLKTYRHNAEIYEQVKKLNGQIVKSLGDGVLATFRIDEPKDIAMPLNAAVRIQKHFDQLNRDIIEEEC